MRTLRAIVVGLLAACLASCQWGEKRPEDAPKEALEKALEALAEEDYDAYLSYVDFGMELVGTLLYGEYSSAYCCLSKSSLS